MVTYTNPKIDVFLGLNNALDPCSNEYAEGMAYVSDQSRVNKSGLWDEQPELVACTSAPTQKTSPFGSGTHCKNLAIENTNLIITEINTAESVDVGANNYLYATYADGTTPNEIQTITITGTPTGGHFHLRFREEITGEIAYNASAADVATALKALDAIGASDVTTAGGAFPGTAVAVTFVGDLADTDVEMMLVLNQLTGGTRPQVSITETTKGGGVSVMYQDAAGNNGAVAELTPPNINATESDGTASRAENGTYFYMATFYDDARKRESLPSNVESVEVDSADGAKDYVKLNVSAPTSTKFVRIYRSFVTSATTETYSAANKFFLVTELKYGSSYDDYLHDTEIANYEYEGRGTPPPQDIDYLHSFNNRMLYFKGNAVYWSSAGRPEEVAQKYSITIGGEEIECIPKLSVRVYGEAKYEITELAGQTVTGATVLNGKLFIWTDGMTGALEATNNLEGYRFKTIRQGIGLVSDKTLVKTFYGVFGADRQGVWLLDVAGYIRRLSDGVIDISTGSGKSTALTQSYVTNSFGVWIPALLEYWWSIQTGASTYIQIAFQANRGIFSGPYNHAIKGGCSFISAGGAQAFINDASSPLVGVTAQEPSSPATAQELRFWFGQASLGTVKENVEVEVFYSSITADKAVTATVYQNNIASTTGATSTGDYSHTDSDLVGRIEPNNSGRMMLVKLVVPSDASAPVIAVGYKANFVPWNSKFKR